MRSVGTLGNHLHGSLAGCVPTQCDPMDCSLPGSSVHGILLGKNTGVGCHISLQGNLLIQRLNLHLLQVSCIGRQILYH